VNRRFDFDRELFGKQTRGHAPHEEQAVDGTLIAREHRVAGTRHQRAAIVDATLTGALSACNSISASSVVPFQLIRRGMSADLHRPVDGSERIGATLRAC
jgi:hypothetical protein